MSAIENVSRRVFSPEASSPRARSSLVCVITANCCRGETSTRYQRR